MSGFYQDCSFVHCAFRTPLIGWSLLFPKDSADYRLENYKSVYSKPTIAATIKMRVGMMEALPSLFISWRQWSAKLPNTFNKPINSYISTQSMLSQVLYSEFWEISPHRVVSFQSSLLFKWEINSLASEGQKGTAWSQRRTASMTNALSHEARHRQKSRNDAFIGV